jgi:hypothetical protein
LGKHIHPMDQPGPSQPPPSSSTTENPVVAVGRKVKSVLSTRQQPSVRILREPTLTGEARRLPIPKSIAKKLAPHLSPHGNAQEPESRAELIEHHTAHAEAHRAPPGENSFASLFAGSRNRAGVAIRSLFGREESSTEDESFEHEYDPDTVDLLDVVGMYDWPSLKASN